MSPLKHAAVLLAGLMILSSQLAVAALPLPPPQQPPSLPAPADSFAPPVTEQSAAPTDQANSQAASESLNSYLDSGVPANGSALDPFGAPPSRPWWQPQSFTGQFLWLSRSRGTDESTLLSSGVLDPVSGLVVHSPAVFLSDLTFPTKIGVRASVLFGHFGNYQSELAYLGMFDQSSTVRFSEPVAETGRYFFDNVFISTTTDVTQSYESDLHSAEWNVWWDGGQPIQWMFGARWFQQSEELEQLETLAVANRALTDVTNDLVGGQAGFRTHLFDRGCLSILVIGKAGAYINNVKLHGDLQNAGVQVAALDQSDETTALASEINVSAVWQFTPYFNFHVGFTSLWLSEVAIAADQFNNFSTVTGTGTFEYGNTTYLGGHLGVTLAW